MSQHGSNPEKKAFRKVNAIYNQEFNASVVQDYEHKLIDLMQGDGHFRLTNKNSGLSSANYFYRDTYAAMFEKLWDDLRSTELVDNSIESVEQSEAFKFSPFKMLNADQEVALQSIVAAIDGRLASSDKKQTTPTVVRGMPGTGKTVLAISLLKVLKDLAVSDDPKYKHFRGINVRLLEPVTGLTSLPRLPHRGSDRHSTRSRPHGLDHDFRSGPHRVAPSPEKGGTWSGAGRFSGSMSVCLNSPICSRGSR